MRARRWTGALAVAAVLALAAGCGGGDEGSSGGSGAGGSSGSSGSSGSGASGTSSTGGSGSRLALAADPSGELAFDKTKLTAKAGKVTIRFQNASSTPHAVEIDGHGVEKETDTITKGSGSVTADLEPGTYEFYCPVGNHRQAGMEGTLTVK